MNPEDRATHDRFLRLFLSQQRGLGLFVRSMLFSQEEEREVMQEVAVVLWRKFEPKMEESAFARWAYGVARMEVLAFRRDRARDRHTFGAELAERLAEDIQVHERRLEDEREALDSCLGKLPAEQSELIRKAYAPGIRIDQLAQSLGRSSMSLYKSLHRIRLTLMECARRELRKNRPA